MGIEENRGTRVLAIDDDQDLLATVEIQLHLKGYTVQTAVSAAEGIALAKAMAPDIVLLDIGLPDKGGLEVILELRANFTTACSGIIMITARSEQSIMREAVSAGADDYLLKPYDPDELCNRIEMVKERTSRNLERNPLTGLPGNNLIRKELNRRIGEGRAFAFGYVDIDNFKAFNDRYGPEVGDQMLCILGNALVTAIRNQGLASDFIGHIGGDDFVFLTTPPTLHVLGEALFERFRADSASLYNPQDLRRGSIAANGRDGVHRQFALCTLSVGATTSLHAKIKSAERAFELATKAKHFAKSRPGDHLEVWGAVASFAKSELPPTRLLIVEEDLELAYHLALGMERKGYTCQTVNRSENAADAVRAFEPMILLADAAILDSEVGHALMAQIRDGEPFTHVPVIAISAKGLPSGQQSLPLFEPDLFCANPLDLDTLEQSVTDLLHGAC